MPKKGETKSNASARSKKQRAYNAQPEQKKNRAARNKARREAEKKGKVRKGDGKDVGHIVALKSGGSKSTKNTRVESVKTNRSNGGRMGGKANGKRKK